MDGVNDGLRQVPLLTSDGTDRMVLAVKMGRGRTGGSTLLDWLIQRARSEGRAIAIADADRRNPTLAGLYPPGQCGGASQPATDETADVLDFVMAKLGEMAEQRTSLVLDLGGGDRLLSELGRDLGLLEFCASTGAAPLALLMSGPETDDFEHVLTLWRSETFRAEHTVLVLNENLVARNRTPAGAFDAILMRPELKEMAANGVLPIFMPRLPCMPMMRDLGLSFSEAMAGTVSRSTGKSLDPVRQFMVRTWHKRMTAEFETAGAMEWLP